MMNEGHAETAGEVFTPGAAAYVRLAMPIWLGRHWWLLLLPAALAVAAAWWPVCLFVMLMVALLLYPSVLMMVYLGYATSRRALTWVYPRTVSFDDAGIAIHYHAGEKFKQIPPDYKLDWESIRRANLSGKTAVAYLKSSPYDIIPLSGSPLAAEQSQRLGGLLAAHGIEFA